LGPSPALAVTTPQQKQRQQQQQQQQQQKQRRRRRRRRRQRQRRRRRRRPAGRGRLPWAHPGTTTNVPRSTQEKTRGGASSTGSFKNYLGPLSAVGWTVQTGGNRAGGQQAGRRGRQGGQADPCRTDRQAQTTVDGRRSVKTWAVTTPVPQLRLHLCP